MAGGYLIADKGTATAAKTLVFTVGTATGGTATLPSATNSIVAVACGGGTNATSCADSRGNTYTHSLADATGDVSVADVFVCLNPTTLLTSGDTVTITWTAATNAVGSLYGVPGGTAVDVAKRMASSTGSTTFSGVSGTLAQASETLIGFMVADSVSASIPASAVPNAPVDNFNTVFGSVQNYQVGWVDNVSATTSVTFSGTFPATHDWDIFVVSLKTTTTTNVTVTGVVSNVTSASPAGTVGIGVIGSVSNVTSASPAGSVSGSAAVVGVVSNVISASPVGSVNIGVSGLVSNVVSASPPGTVGIGVIGHVSNVTSASPAGAVTGSANVTGLVSNVTSASPPGKVTIGVTGHVSNVTSASPAGTVGIGVIGVVSHVTSASPVGAVTGTATVTGVVSNVTSASPAGTVSGTANVIGVVSNVTSASPPVSFAHDANVIGVVSNVTSASPAGTVPRKIFDFGGSTAADKDQFDGIATLASPVYNGSATLVSPLYNGTASNNLYDGTISQFTYNGTADVEPVYNGIATMATVFDGTTEGFIMQTQNVTLGEFNDELVNVAIKDSGGSAVNLTGKTLKAYLKTAAGVSDSDPSTIVLASGGAINWVSQSGGTAQVAIAHADISDLSVGFWRVDVVDGSGNQNTAIQGTVTITPL